MDTRVIAGLLTLLALAVVLIRQRLRAVLAWPLAGTVRITSAFGNRVTPTAGASTDHTGIDLSAPVGTPVKCPADGTVTNVYTTGSGGNQLTIKHDNGLTTGYAHLSRYGVKSGDKVLAGQLIAYTGNTGTTTGPHLHFSVKDNTGQFVDPLNYLA
ncbi:M23 family metallopeptidase [Spirosoma litoris]